MKRLIPCLTILLMVGCDSPTAPSHGPVDKNPPDAILEPRGDINMRTGESKIFTVHGIVDGYEYSWSGPYRPDSNKEYGKIEIISPEQVRFTALRITRECDFLGICIDTPVYLWVYLTKNNVAYGRNNEARIHIQ